MQKYRQPYGKTFAEFLVKFRDQPDRLKEETYKLFQGTMGSLSDIWLCSDNGNPVEREKETNWELSALLDVLYEEVKDPVRDQIPEYNEHLLKVYPKTHDEAEEVFASDILERLFDVLVWITYYDSDWRWVQQQCLNFTYYDNPELRKLAVSCLVDLAQLHGSLESGTVLTRLAELMSNGDVCDRAQAAVSEINKRLSVLS